MHWRHLAVHQFLGMHNLAAERFADRLMPKANAEQRNLAGKLADDGERNPGLRRSRRSRRDHQILGIQARDLAQRDRVVAEDLHLLPQLAEVLDDVVGEGVVVVDH